MLSLVTGAVPATQPVAGLQVSVPLQNWPSLQFLAEPEQPPAPSQTSESVHALPSLQVTVAFWFCSAQFPVIGLHVFLMHCVSPLASHVMLEPTFGRHLFWPVVASARHSRTPLQTLPSP